MKSCISEIPNLNHCTNSQFILISLSVRDNNIKFVQYQCILKQDSTQNQRMSELLITIKFRDKLYRMQTLAGTNNIIGKFHGISVDVKEIHLNEIKFLFKMKVKIQDKTNYCRYLFFSSRYHKNNQSEKWNERK